MLFAVKGRFKPDVEAQRATLAQDFSEHLRQPLLHIRLVGGLADEQGVCRGMLMLMEAESREQLDHFLALSPYNKAGLYERLDVDVLQIEAGGLN